MGKSKLMEIEEKLRLTPDDPRLWLEKGLELAELFCHCEAVDAFSQGLYWDGASAELHLARGRRYISLKRFPEALADLTAAARLQPESFDNWYYQGVAHALNGDYPKAAASMERCLAVVLRGNESLLPPAVVWLWLLNMRLGRREDAAAALTYVTEETKELAAAPSYKKIALLYKGIIPPDNFIDESQLAGDDPRALYYYITETFHLSNYYYLNGNQEKSDLLLLKLKEIDKYNHAFAYMLAQQDMSIRKLL